MMIAEKLFSDAVGGDSGHVADHMPSTSMLNFTPYPFGCWEETAIYLAPIWAWSSHVIPQGFISHQVFEESMMVDDGAMTIPC